MSQKIIVIGGGIAGLTASYYLNKYGYKVKLLEASALVGGRMATFRNERYIIDTGAQFLSTGYKNILNLLDELNLKHEIAETTQKGGIIKNNRIYALDYHKPFSLLTSGFLSPKQFLSLALGSLKLKRKIKNLSPGVYSDWHLFDTETVQEWSDAYYGKTVTDYLFEPTLEAFYFQTPEETSKALAIAISKFNSFKTITLKSGINRLPLELAKKTDIEFNSNVVAIDEQNDSLKVHTKDKSYSADYIVLATTADEAKKFYKNANPIEKKLLNTGYSSTINIALGLKNKLSGKFAYYGIFVPQKERKIIAAIAVESNKHSQRVRGEGDLINVMLSGKAGKPYLDKSEKEIIETVKNELEKYIPGISKNIIFTKMFRWKKAEPCSPVGRSKYINEYRQTIDKSTKILLAGDYTGMPFTEGAAETGKWAADTINNIINV